MKAALAVTALVLVMLTAIYLDTARVLRQQRGETVRSARLQRVCAAQLDEAEAALRQARPALWLFRKPPNERSST